MEKKSYTYGSKLAGMILHLFFTVILTIAVYLLASLISKNILQERISVQMIFLIRATIPNAWSRNAVN